MFSLLTVVISTPRMFEADYLLACDNGCSGIYHCDSYYENNHKMATNSNTIVSLIGGQDMTHIWHVWATTWLSHYCVQVRFM